MITRSTWTTSRVVRSVSNATPFSAGARRSSRNAGRNTENSLATPSNPCWRGAASHYDDPRGHFSIRLCMMASTNARRTDGARRLEANPGGSYEPDDYRRRPLKSLGTWPGRRLSDGHGSSRIDYATRERSDLYREPAAGTRRAMDVSLPPRQIPLLSGSRPGIICADGMSPNGVPMPTGRRIENWLAGIDPNKMRNGSRHRTGDH